MSASRAIRDDPIAAGIAIDRDGRPTTSAKAALDGALTPLGGHKGFALGLAVGLLSGPVIGAVIGTRAGAGARCRSGRAQPRPPVHGDRSGGLRRCRGKPAQRTAAFLAEIKAGRKATGMR